MVAMYYGIIDRPDNVRKMHTVPVAYLGGVAVFLGWLAGLAISQFLTLHRIEVGWPTDYPVVKFSIVHRRARHRRARAVGRHASASARG